MTRAGVEGHFAMTPCNSLALTPHEAWDAGSTLSGHAARFERYLKTGSGRAFAKRHFGVNLA